MEKLSKEDLKNPCKNLDKESLLKASKGSYLDDSNGYFMPNGDFHIVEYAQHLAFAMVVLEDYEGDEYIPISEWDDIPLDVFGWVKCHAPCGSLIVHKGQNRNITPEQRAKLRHYFKSYYVSSTNIPQMFQFEKQVPKRYKDGEIDDQGNKIKE